MTAKLYQWRPDAEAEYRRARMAQFAALDARRIAAATPPPATPAAPVDRTRPVTPTGMTLNKFDSKGRLL